jgi:hypothetical protein
VGSRAPRVHEPVRQNRVDYESDQSQKDGATNFLVRQPARESRELRLQREKRGSLRWRMRWGENVAFAGEDAERKCHHQRGRGGCFKRPVMQCISDVYNRDQYENTGKACDHENGRDQRARVPSNAIIAKVRTPRSLWDHSLSLKADQQTDPQRNRHFQRDFFGWQSYYRFSPLRF